MNTIVCFPFASRTCRACFLNVLFCKHFFFLNVNSIYNKLFKCTLTNYSSFYVNISYGSTPWASVKPHSVSWKLKSIWLRVDLSISSGGLNTDRVHLDLNKIQVRSIFSSGKVLAGIIQFYEFQVEQMSLKRLLYELFFYCQKSEIHNYYSKLSVFNENNIVL